MGMQKNLMLRVLTLTLMLLPLAHAELRSCDFDYLAPYVTSEFKLLDLTSSQQAWDSGITRAMPYAKRIYTSTDPHYVFLHGWYESPEDLSQGSRRQVIDAMNEAHEEQREHGIRAEISFPPGDPLTLYVKKQFEVNDIRYDNLRMVVLASPRCLVGFEIGGPSDAFKESDWKFIDNRLAAVRKKILKDFGQVKFAQADEASAALDQVPTETRLLAVPNTRALVSAIVGLLALIGAVYLGRVTKNPMAAASLQVGGAIVAIALMGVIAGDTKTATDAGIYFLSLAIAFFVVLWIFKKIFVKRHDSTAQLKNDGTDRV